MCRPVGRDVIVRLKRCCGNVGEYGGAFEDLTAFQAGTSRNFDETTARIFDQRREVAARMGRRLAAGAVRAGFGFGRVGAAAEPAVGQPWQGIGTTLR